MAQRLLYYTEWRRLMFSRFRMRAIALMVSALVVPVGLAASPAAPAHADVLDIACTSLFTVTFSPGISLHAQTITASYSGDLTLCASPSEPDITSGVISGTATGGASCLGGSVSGTATITWNTDQSSTLSLQTIVPFEGAEELFGGVVTYGAFDGDTIVLEDTSTGVTGNCLEGGITQATADGEIEFTSL
jgi:hypothetical protein